MVVGVVGIFDPLTFTTLWAKTADDKLVMVIFYHYENTPIQIYRKFHLQKLKIFR